MLRAFLRWVNPRNQKQWQTFWRMVLFWNPVICIVFTAVFNKFDSFVEYTFDLGIALIIGTTTIITCFTLNIIVQIIETAILRSKDIQAREHGIGWHLLVSGSGLPIGVYLGFTLTGWLLGFEPFSLRGLAYGVVIGVAVMLAFFLFETVGELRVAKTLAELRRKEVENEKLRRQVALLTAQMNPHLLFNTLNTIASLTHSDPNAAEQTILELAKLYRGVLNAARKERHSLADELAICLAYLSIEQARFQDRLKFEIHMDGVEQDAVAIPPLLLQPLVENAVKHGLLPKAEGGEVHLEITTQDNRLRIRILDDGVGINNSLRSNHESTALANLRTRLRLLHGSKASILFRNRDSGGTAVELIIPKVAL